MKTTVQIVQVSPELPNPVISLSGYTPQTDYWPKMIKLVNGLIEASVTFGSDADVLKKGANQVFKTRMFDEKGEHKGYEWAEFVMAINHMLWFWNDYEEKNATEYLEPVLKALNDLYYEWHGKAIHNLKGDTLSEYLRITD